jgi:hypothetical protein
MKLLLQVQFINGLDSGTKKALSLVQSYVTDLVQFTVCHFKATCNSYILNSVQGGKYEKIKVNNPFVIF